MPVGPNFAQGLRMATEVFHHLKVLKTGVSTPQ